MPDTETPLDPEAQQYVDDMIAARGYVLRYHQILAASDYKVLQAANGLISAAYLRERRLSRATKELIFIVSLIVLGAPKEHVQSHIKVALNCGVTPEEILEAIEITLPEAGVVAFQRGVEIGRFCGVYWKSLGREDMSFDEAIRRNLYYDTCLYTPESLEFLLRTMGCDNVVFGTERPGDGSHKHGGAGSVAWADDLKTIIEEIPGFKPAELDQVFSGNILSAYLRLADKFGTVPAAVPFAGPDGGENGRG